MPLHLLGRPMPRGLSNSSTSMMSLLDLAPLLKLLPRDPDGPVGLGPHLSREAGLDMVIE